MVCVPLLVHVLVRTAVGVQPCGRSLLCLHSPLQDDAVIYDELNRSLRFAATTDYAACRSALLPEILADAPEHPAHDAVSSDTWSKCPAKSADHSFAGSFALSIRSRTQGAPPKRCSFSFCASDILIVTGAVAGAPTTFGFLPPPSRAPPCDFLMSMLEWYT